MNNDTFKSAEKMIKASVILRLLISALSALLLAYSLSKDIRLKVYDDSFFLLQPVVYVFLMDMIFTILWQFSAILYVFHLICYIVLGGIFYLVYFGLVFTEASIAEKLNITDALTAESFGYTHVVISWVIGLIPFVLYMSGIIKLKKANRERISINR